MVGNIAVDPKKFMVSSRTVFVGNLPPHEKTTLVESLKQTFTIEGDEPEVCVKRSKRGKKSLYAFLEFQNEASAEKAIGLAPVIILGAKVTLRSKSVHTSVLSVCNLWVGEIDEKLSYEALKDLFNGYSYLSISPFYTSDRGKYCFVNFLEVSIAEQCYEDLERSHGNGKSFVMKLQFPNNGSNSNDVGGNTQSVNTLDMPMSSGRGVDFNSSGGYSGNLSHNSNDHFNAFGISDHQHHQQQQHHIQHHSMMPMSSSLPYNAQSQLGGNYVGNPYHHHQNQQQQQQQQHFGMINDENPLEAEVLVATAIEIEKEKQQLISSLPSSGKSRIVHSFEMTSSKTTDLHLDTISRVISGDNDMKLIGRVVGRSDDSLRLQIIHTFRMDIMLVDTDSTILNVRVNNSEINMISFSSIHTFLKKLEDKLLREGLIKGSPETLKNVDQNLKEFLDEEHKDIDVKKAIKTCSQILHECRFPLPLASIAFDKTLIGRLFDAIFLRALPTIVQVYIAELLDKIGCGYNDALKIGLSSRIGDIPAGSVNNVKILIEKRLEEFVNAANSASAPGLDNISASMLRLKATINSLLEGSPIIAPQQTPSNQLTMLQQQQQKLSSELSAMNRLKKRQQQQQQQQRMPQNRQFAHSSTDMMNHQAAIHQQQQQIGNNELHADILRRLSLIQEQKDQQMKLLQQVKQQGNGPNGLGYGDALLSSFGSSTVGDNIQSHIPKQHRGYRPSSEPLTPITVSAPVLPPAMISRSKQIQQHQQKQERRQVQQHQETRPRHHQQQYRPNTIHRQQYQQHHNASGHSRNSSFGSTSSNGSSVMSGFGNQVDGKNSSHSMNYRQFNVPSHSKPGFVNDYPSSSRTGFLPNRQSQHPKFPVNAHPFVPSSTARSRENYSYYQGGHNSAIDAIEASMLSLSSVGTNGTHKTVDDCSSLSSIGHYSGY